jgi:hypothetical protein
LAKKLVHTTVYSLSNEAPAQPDRRQGDRYVSLLRVGALIVDGRRELCLIRNVSAGGMMIRPYSTIPAGTAVSIELKHGETVSGIAQWSDRGLIGISFDQPINVLELVCPTGTDARPRMPRVELGCSARLHRDGNAGTGRVANISQGGICVTTRTLLPIDADVVVTLPGLRPAAGVVKWADGEEYGIRFNRVFPLDELMAFLREQQRDERRKAAAG